MARRPRIGNPAFRQTAVRRAVILVGAASHISTRRVAARRAPGTLPRSAATAARPFAADQDARRSAPQGCENARRGRRKQHAVSRRWRVGPAGRSIALRSRLLLSRGRRRTARGCHAPAATTRPASFDRPSTRAGSPRAMTGREEYASTRLVCLCTRQECSCIRRIQRARVAGRRGHATGFLTPVTGVHAQTSPARGRLTRMGARTTSSGDCPSSRKTRTSTD